MTSEKEIKKLFSRFGKLKVAVVGDVMLDKYVIGKTDRISPEAPVPVVVVQRTEARCGGAGNVAINIQAMEATPYLFTVIGNDIDGDAILQHLKSSGINTQTILRSSSRITTSKTRIISSNHQMLRIDQETTEDIDAATEQKLLRSLKNFIENQSPDILIFEDYNKGVLTENLIRTVIGWCNEKSIPVAVDPKKKNFFAYAGCTLFKPNLREVKESLGTAFSGVDSSTLNKASDQLYKQLHQQITMITLGELGIYVREGKKVFRRDAHVRKIADVSGAGDTVISVASLCLAAGAETGLTTAIANIAGGMVCEHAGVVPVNKTQLLKESLQLLC